MSEAKQGDNGAGWFLIAGTGLAFLAYPALAIVALTGSKSWVIGGVVWVGMTTAAASCVHIGMELMPREPDRPNNILMGPSYTPTPLPL